MQSLAKSRSGGRSMLLSEELSLSSEFTAGIKGPPLVNCILFVFWQITMYTAKPLTSANGQDTPSASCHYRSTLPSLNQNKDLKTLHKVLGN